MALLNQHFKKEWDEIPAVRDGWIQTERHQLLQQSFDFLYFGGDGEPDVCFL